jgi:hypothetical protein
MRMLVEVHIPAATGSKAIQDGRLPRIVQQTMARFKPEAAYFGPHGGTRAAFFVFDMASAADLPAALEPFFGELEAEVEMTPVMNVTDLTAGLAAMGQP